MQRHRRIGTTTRPIDPHRAVTRSPRSHESRVWDFFAFPSHRLAVLALFTLFVFDGLWVLIEGPSGSGSVSATRFPPFLTIIFLGPWLLSVYTWRAPRGHDDPRVDRWSEWLVLVALGFTSATAVVYLANGFGALGALSFDPRPYLYPAVVFGTSLAILVGLPLPRRLREVSWPGVALAVLPGGLAILVYSASIGGNGANELVGASLMASGFLWEAGYAFLEPTGPAPGIVSPAAPPSSTLSLDPRGNPGPSPSTPVSRTVPETSPPQTEPSLLLWQATLARRERDLAEYERRLVDRARQLTQRELEFVRLESAPRSPSPLIERSVPTPPSSLSAPVATPRPSSIGSVRGPPPAPPSQPPPTERPTWGPFQPERTPLGPVPKSSSPAPVLRGSPVTSFPPAQALLASSVPAARRVPTGFPALDTALSGGFPPTCEIALRVGDRTETLRFVSTFLMQGLRRGDSALLLTLRDTAGETLRGISACEPAFADHMQNGNVLWVDGSQRAATLSGHAGEQALPAEGGPSNYANVLARLLSSVRNASLTGTGRPRVAVLGASEVLNVEGPAKGQVFLRNLNAILKGRRTATLIELDVEDRWDRTLDAAGVPTDGTIFLRREGGRTLARVEGVGEGAVRGWIDIGPGSPLKSTGTLPLRSP